MLSGHCCVTIHDKCLCCSADNENVVADTCLEVRTSTCSAQHGNLAWLPIECCKRQHPQQHVFSIPKMVMHACLKESSVNNDIRFLVNFSCKCFLLYLPCY